ncbi:hypothetical protein BDZ91DRAFT_840106 [Kalaharituber pfeilii]|nr:hypothetical protein BDZ91DRAFT_840106 [Kalaharituber pfeilii]
MRCRVYAPWNGMEWKEAIKALTLSMATGVRGVRGPWGWLAGWLAGWANSGCRLASGLRGYNRDGGDHPWVARGRPRRQCYKQYIKIYTHGAHDASQRPEGASRRPRGGVREGGAEHAIGQAAARWRGRPAWGGRGGEGEEAGSVLSSALECTRMPGLLGWLGWGRKGRGAKGSEGKARGGHAITRADGAARHAAAGATPSPALSLCWPRLLSSRADLRPPPSIVPHPATPPTPPPPHPLQTRHDDLPHPHKSQSDAPAGSHILEGHLIYNQKRCTGSLQRLQMGTSFPTPKLELRGAAGPLRISQQWFVALRTSSSNPQRDPSKELGRTAM